MTITKPITLNGSKAGIRCEYSSEVNVNFRSEGIVINAPTALVASPGIIYVYRKSTITFGSDVITKCRAEEGGRIEFGPQGWQLIGSVAGANSVAIDSNLYTEFRVIQEYAGVRGECVVSSVELLTEEKRYSLGGYYSSSNTHRYGNVAISKAGIRNNILFEDGTNVLPSSTMSVYGKR